MVGFLDDLFGAGDAQDDINRGARRSNEALDVGAAGGREGIEQARQDVTSGAAAARSNLALGRDDITAGRDSALGFLSGDRDAGDAARGNLLAALGLSGVDAQQGFFSNFQDDPGFAASLGAGIGAIDQSAASRGNIFSGGTQKDLFEFGQQARLGAFRDRLDRLTGLSSIGSQANANSANVATGAAGNLAGLATNQANVEVGLGDRLAGLSSESGNLEFGLGQLKANTATNQSNAIADTRGVGLNNLVGLAGAGLRAAGGFV